jgi:hypothetical protein
VTCALDHALTGKDQRPAGCHVDHDAVTVDDLIAMRQISSPPPPPAGHDGKLVTGDTVIS